MSDLFVIATLVSKDGKADLLREQLLPAIEKFREEDGCLGYTLLEDRKRPGRFMTYERWRDQAALTAHMSSTTMQDLTPRMPELLGEEMTQDFLATLVSL
jgi:quinol monooxygenase YgiN